MGNDSKPGDEVEVVSDTDLSDRTNDEPPVVARLVVEIRSDGRQTIARGAMDDVESGHSVAIEARGSSPLELAFGLARAITRGPRFARTAVRALLPRRRKR